MHFLKCKGILYIYEFSYFLILCPTAEFSIWTREAGAGGLSIAVEGPSKAEIAFEDRKDGSSGVSYIVQEPGKYSLSLFILFKKWSSRFFFIMKTNIMNVNDGYGVLFLDVLCRRL